MSGGLCLQGRLAVVKPGLGLFGLGVGAVIRLGGVAWLALAASRLCSSHAFAEERPAEPSSGEAVRIQPVVVTAQRREQSPADVPVSLTAYSGDFLKQLGVQDLRSASLYVPSYFVQEESPDNAPMVLRGISTRSMNATDEPRISVFQDGVAISRSPGAFVELFDVQRLEIERGPQTSLFGRSALLGAVNIVDNRADPSRLDWSLHLEGGDYAYGEAEGMANLPLGRDLALRMAGRYRRRDGFVDNALGGPALNSLETGAVRVSLAWRPGPVSTDLILAYEEDRPSGTSYKSGTFYPTDPNTGAPLAGLDPLAPTAISVHPDFSAGDRLGSHRRIWSATALLDAPLSAGLSLQSISAFRHFQNRLVYDPDGFSFPILSDAEIVGDDQWSQEFRLTYDTGGRISAVGGVNLLADRSSYQLPYDFSEPLALALLTGALNRANPNPGPMAAYTSPATQAALLRGLAAAYGYALPLPVAQGIAANLSSSHQERSGDTQSLRSFDLYQDTTFKLTERLSLSGGVRYEHDDKTTRYFAQTLNGRSVLGGVLGALSLRDPLRTQLLGALAVPGAGSIPQSAAFPVPNFGLQAQPTAGNGQVDSAELRDGGLSWRVTARYALTPDIGVYASYAHGRRPQVLSAQSAAAPGGPAVFTDVPAEIAESYELGAKARLLNDRLELDGDVYDYGYSHFQIQQLIGTQLVTTDAGSARTWGVELQGRWRLGQAAQLFATYAYTHDRFKTGLYVGNRFALSPDHAFSIGAILSRPAPGGRVEFVPTYSWRSRAYFDDFNGDLAKLSGAILVPRPFADEQRAYGLVNLRLSYARSDRPWSVGAFMTNAADTSYLTSAGNTGTLLGLPTFVAGPPRMVGLFFELRS